MSLRQQLRERSMIIGGALLILLILLIMLNAYNLLSLYVKIADYSSSSVNCDKTIDGTVTKIVRVMVLPIWTSKLARKLVRRGATNRKDKRR